jgi:hypothetical protein
MSVFAVMPAPKGVLANRPGAAAIGREPARIAVGRPQTAQLGRHWLGQRDAPLFVVFADSLAVIDIAHRNLDRLADAQATGIHQLKAGPVDWITYRSQDGADLGIRERDRQPLLPRRANAFFWENSAQLRSSVLE